MSNQFILAVTVEAGALEAIAVDDIVRITPETGGATDDLRIYLDSTNYRTVADITLFDFFSGTRVGGFRR